MFLRFAWVFLLPSSVNGKCIVLANAEIVIYHSSSKTHRKVTDIETGVEHFLKIKECLKEFMEGMTVTR